MRQEEKQLICDSCGFTVERDPKLFVKGTVEVLENLFAIVFHDTIVEKSGIVELTGNTLKYNAPDKGGGMIHLALEFEEGVIQKKEVD
jgi:hypothetical protein